MSGRFLHEPGTLSSGGGQAFQCVQTVAFKRIEGGFHGGLDVTFGPGLNAIIGGKGTGKSTLVEVLRYVLEAPPSIAPRPVATETLTNREVNFPAKMLEHFRLAAIEAIDRITEKRRQAAIEEVRRGGW